MAPTDDAESDTGTDAEAVRRRWIVRLLVGLGFGIPIAIEGATVLGMLESWLFGEGGGSDGDSPTDDGAPGDPDEDRLSVGDEVLPETPPREELRSAVVVAGDDARQFRVLVAVENRGSDPYVLRIDRITTDAGTVVEEPAATETIAPGASGRLEHAWSLPAGEVPAWVTVAGVSSRGGADEVVERRRRLGEVAVGG